MNDELVRGTGGGEPDEWDDPVRGRITFRTMFSGELTGTEGLTAGIAEVAPGDVFRAHRHPQTEVYLVLAGEGKVLLDGTETPIAKDDAVFVPSDRVHGVVATGQTPLRMFYVLDADAMTEVDYEFTDR
jgi:quercetin dioxygenase-like cupin family protein